MEVKKFYKEGNEYTLPIAGGGGGEVENMVTTDTEQTIVADKTFEDAEVHIFDTDGNGTTLGQGTIRMDHGDTTFMIRNQGSTSFVENRDNAMAMSEYALQLTNTADGETMMTLKDGKVDFSGTNITFRSPDADISDDGVLTITPRNNDGGTNYDTISSDTDIFLEVGDNRLSLETSGFTLEAGDGDDANARIGIDGDGWLYGRGNERVEIAITQNEHTSTEGGHTKDLIDAWWEDEKDNPRLTVGGDNIDVNINGNVKVNNVPFAPKDSCVYTGIRGSTYGSRDVISCADVGIKQDGLYLIYIEYDLSTGLFLFHPNNPTGMKLGTTGDFDTEFVSFQFNPGYFSFITYNGGDDFGISIFQLSPSIENY